MMKLYVRLGLIAVTSVIVTMAGVSAADDIDAANVYQRINDADTNGFSVRRFSGGLDLRTEDIILDEQGKSKGLNKPDVATRPLFRKVNEAKLLTGTYPELIKMFDNYVLKMNETE